MPREARVGLGLVLLAGASLRLYGLTEESAWVDEVLSVGNATGHPIEVLKKLEPHLMPVYFWVASPFVALSASEVWLRLPSVVIGTAVIAVVFMVPAALGRIREALCAASLAGASSFLVLYSQEIRMYILVALFAMVGTWSVVRLGAGPEAWASRRPLRVLIAASILNLYTSPFAIFIVASHWCVLLGIAWRQPTVRRCFAISTAIVGLASVPGIVHMVPLVTGSAAVVSHETSSYDDLGEMVRVTLGYFAGFHGDRGLMLGSGMLLAGIAGAFVSWRTSAPLVCLSLLAFALPLATLYLSKPGHFFHPRYLIFVQPHLLLLVSFALVWLWQRLTRATRTALPPAVELCAVALLGAAVLLWPLLRVSAKDLAPRRTDLKGLSAALFDGLEAGDVIAVHPSYDTSTILYHLDQAAPAGRRVQLAEGSDRSRYESHHRRPRERQHPESYRGPVVELVSLKRKEDMALLLSRSGRVWIVAPRKLPESVAAAFELHHRSEWRGVYARPGGGRYLYRRLAPDLGEAAAGHP